ncbi:MAG: DUF697 domain-containing protein [Tistlia sp.]|uniref:YcjF family protein n=1 Tax=Tistlia sp. TaxID=3057121 RepID=UPI0034A12BB3
MATRKTSKTEAADAAAARERPDGSVTVLDPITEKPDALAASGTVKSHVIAAMAIGTLPLPLFDGAALFALQLRMIRRICERYGHSFSEKAVRATVLALAGGSGSVGLGLGAASLLKLVPGVGWALGGLGMPAVAGAATYALGQTYIRHFEDGGTILDLDARKLRAFYNEQFRKGRTVAAEAAPA